MNFRLDLHPLLSNCQIFPTFAVYNQNVETMTYLDPKADLTFKKVFGEHEELVKSLLNALLPFQTAAFPNAGGRNPDLGIPACGISA